MPNTTPTLSPATSVSPNNKVDLQELIGTLSDACVSAAGMLEASMKKQGANLPFTYVLPEIGLEVAITLSSESGKLKAIFTDNQSTQVASKLTFRYVAAPRTGGG